LSQLLRRPRRKIRQYVTGACALAVRSPATAPPKPLQARHEDCGDEFHFPIAIYLFSFSAAIGAK
jgi:hypothetical protein